MTDLGKGDLLPRIVHPPPGPRARALCADLRRFEAPGINTLAGDQSNILWQEARGANVQDVDGNVYIDLTAGFGVAAVGHGHPRVRESVVDQAGRLLHGLGDAQAHPQRIALAARLAHLAPIDDAQVYFAVSGADAVEVALKTASLATGRPGIVAFEPAYHGLTLGALATTSRHGFRAPFRQHLHSHVYRLEFGCAIAQLRRLLIQEQTIGCLIVEPIVGREGVLVPPEGWLAEVAEACRRRGILVIADEIFTGFGRTGALFAVQREGARVDLLCCGKALGGGLPIAAVLGRRDILKSWQTPGEALHTGTFVANPLACAAALAVLEVIDEEKLVARARVLGEVFSARLSTWLARAEVEAVRGRGLVWGIELDSPARAAGWVRRVLGSGLLVLAGGPGGNVVELTPPLTITDEQIEAALHILEARLAPVPGSSGSNPG